MHHSSVSWEITLLYFFSWNFILFWSKKSIKGLSFILSISPNLYFDRVLLLKEYKISAKKVQRTYVTWHWRVMENFKKNQFVISKMTIIWWILIRAFKSLKNWHFDWSLPFMNLKSHAKFKENLTCGLENGSRNLANFHQNP